MRGRRERRETYALKTDLLTSPGRMNLQRWVSIRERNCRRRSMEEGTERRRGREWKGKEIGKEERREYLLEAAHQILTLGQTGPNGCSPWFGKDFWGGTRGLLHQGVQVIKLLLNLSYYLLHPAAWSVIYPHMLDEICTRFERWMRGGGGGSSG